MFFKFSAITPKDLSENQTALSLGWFQVERLG